MPRYAAEAAKKDATRVAQPRSSGPVDSTAAKQAKDHNKREKEKMINRIIDRMMANPSHVSLDEITKSEEFKKALFRRMRNSQTPTKDLKSFVQTLDVPVTDVKPYEDIFQGSSFIRLDEIEPAEIFEVLEDSEGELPAGSIVHKDVVLTFQNELPLESKGNVVIVAAPSDGLRCVFPEINGSTEKVEAVIDGGSQIVAISSWVAQGVGLQWDPSTKIHMQSANGTLESTLGICRNVPFKFGEITVYLQLHVVQKAPFQVLLGRPFDVLTESEVKNFGDGDQWLTVTCPNSRNQCVIPTYERGQGVRMKPKRDFTLRPQNIDEDRKGREEPEPSSGEKAEVNFHPTSRN